MEEVNILPSEFFCKGIPNWYERDEQGRFINIPHKAYILVCSLKLKGTKKMPNQQTPIYMTIDNRDGNGSIITTYNIQDAKKILEREN